MGGAVGAPVAVGIAVAVGVATQGGVGVIASAGEAAGNTATDVTVGAEPHAADSNRKIRMAEYDQSPFDDVSPHSSRAKRLVNVAISGARPSPI